MRTDDKIERHIRKELAYHDLRLRKLRKRDCFNNAQYVVFEAGEDPRNCQRSMGLDELSCHVEELKERRREYLAERRREYLASRNG